MAQLREKAWMAQLHAKAWMAQLPAEAQVARPAAEHIPEASENKEFKLNTSVQICTSDADTSKNYMKWVHVNTVYKWGVCQMCSTQVAYQCSRNQHVIRSMINARKLKGTWKPMLDNCASLRRTIPSSEATISST